MVRSFAKSQAEMTKLVQNWKDSYKLLENIWHFFVKILREPCLQGSNNVQYIPYNERNEIIILITGPKIKIYYTINNA